MKPLEKLVLILSVIALGACRDSAVAPDEPQTPDPVDPVLEIRVDPDSAVVARGDVLRLRARLYERRGTTYHLLNAEMDSARWASSDTAVARVSQSGEVLGVSAGTTRITVEAAGLTAEASVVAYVRAGEALWIATGGDVGHDWGRAAAVHPAGTVYVYGETLLGPAARFDSIALPVGSDRFAVSYAPEGTVLSAHPVQYESSAPVTHEATERRAIDASGNVYLAGGWYGMGGGSNLPPGGAYVAKFAPGGSLLWERIASGAHDATPNAIAVDNTGSVYIAATIRGEFEFGDWRLFHEDGDFALIKLAPDGEVLWAAQSDAPYDANGATVAVDGSGNVLAAGRFTLELTVGPTMLRGGSDAFLAKYDAAGAALWAVAFASGGLNEITGVASDGAGNVYVGGSFSGTLRVGTISLVACKPFGYSEVFLVKLAPDGSPLWGWKSCGGSGDAEVTALAVSPSGRVTFAGSFLGELRLGSFTMPSQGWWDSFVATFSPDGSLLWAGQLASSGDVAIHDVAIGGPNDGIYIVGYFDEELRAGLTVTSAGGQDLFLARFDP